MFKPEEEDPAVRDWKVAMLDKVFAPPTSFRDLEMRSAPDKVYAEPGCVHHEAASECAVCSDVVNAPSHYTQLPVECVDVAEHFGYLLGNVIKYVWRHQHKGKPLEDLRKARYYLERAISKLEDEGR